MHQFEDATNTQTHQAIKKEDDEHWEKVFEQISISFKDEQSLYEVMSNTQKFVNMWIIWIHTRENICEDDIQRTKTQSRE